MTIEEALGVLDIVLKQDSLNNTQELVFRYAWEGRTYEEIAEILGYVTDYIRSVGAQLWSILSDAFGERVTKNNLQTVLRRWVKQQRLDDRPSERLPSDNRQDWGDAPDIFGFVGRAEELATLEHWITVDRCRLVALLGMGGIGKTSLAVTLAKRLQHQFDHVVWRSLRNAPSAEDLLASLIDFLSDRQEVEAALPVDLTQRGLLLIDYLRKQRCLIVLDNAETILSGTAQIQAGNGGYSELLGLLLDVPHQSCVLLTSREKPDAIAWKEGTTLPVRSLHLRGLTLSEGQKIFEPKGIFSASLEDWNTLIQHYAGNPLALKMVAAAIEDLFNNNISEFLSLLHQGTLVFDDIRDLLDRQFDRLSDEEKEVMYWLAIHREVITFTELQQDLLSPSSKQRLPGTLRSLRHRFLIEKNALGFTQQPVVMEYLTEKLVDQIYSEICSETIELLMSYALVKAQAKDYVRDHQTRLILQPIVDRLKMTFGLKEIEQKLSAILRKLQTTFQAAPGYAGGNLLNLFGCLKLDLSNRDFSNLVIWQASLQEMNLHHLNFANADLARSVFMETLGNVWSVAFSPDGTVLAASDTSGDIHCWRVADGKKLLTCKEHNHWVCAIGFSANGKRLISGSADMTVKLWDVQTGECLKTFYGHTDWIISVAFVTDEIVVSSGVDCTIRFWDLSTGTCFRTLADHSKWVCTIAASRDGQRVISGSDDGTVRVWNAQTGHCLQTLKGHTSYVRTVAINPTGDLIASGSDDRTVKLWQMATGECLATLRGHTSHLRSIAFSPDGQTVISGSEDHTLRLWDVSTGRCLKNVQGHTAHVRSVAVSPDGKLLASGGADQTVKLWDSQTVQCLRTLQGYTNFVLSVAFSPDGHTLASGSADQTVRLWQLEPPISPPVREKRELGKRQSFQEWGSQSSSGLAIASPAVQPSPHLLKGHTNWIVSVSFSPDGKLLASGSFDQTIRLWDVQTRQCLRIFRGHTNWVQSVAFSPDGQWLASSSSDQTVRLWDIYTGNCVKVLRGHTSHVWSIAFSPNGRLLGSGGDDCTVILWETQTGNCLQRLRGHSHRIHSIAFSPDGKTLASSSIDQTVKLWDLSRFAQEPASVERSQVNLCAESEWLLHSPSEKLVGRIGCAKTLAFSPDGQTLASNTTTPTIFLWNMAEVSQSEPPCNSTAKSPDVPTDVQTRKRPTPQLLQGHTNRIWSVAFSPTGDMLASSGEDGTIRLWNPTTGECLSILRNPRPYEGMNITGVTGITEAQKRVLKTLGAIEVDDFPIHLN